LVWLLSLSTRIRNNTINKTNNKKMKISNDYAWLGSITDAPLMIKEAVRIGKLNTNEIPGPKSNSEIMKLAETAGVKDIYKNDDVAWCAVAMSAIAIVALKELPFTGYDRLRAASFLKFGLPVSEPMLGDVLVFTRTGGGHVGLYVGEDKDCYHVAGGNQGNQVNVVRISKNRLSGARRPKYNVTPKSVHKYFLSPLGAVSKNEA
jgi:uncharacterized protein (TIGR02594 family)